MNNEDEMKELPTERRDLPTKTPTAEMPERGRETSVPDVLSNEYAELLDEVYVANAMHAMYEFRHNQMPLEQFNDELDRIEREYNEGIFEIVSNRNELELVDYDEQHPQEIARAEKERNRKLREHLAQLKAEERDRKAKERAEALRRANAKLQEEIAKRENNLMSR